MISGAKSYDESVLLRLVFARLQDFTLQEAAAEVLVAAAHGGEAMMAVIEAWLVDHAGRELLRDLD